MKEMSAVTKTTTRTRTMGPGHKTGWLTAPPPPELRWGEAQAGPESHFWPCTGAAGVQTLAESWGHHREEGPWPKRWFLQDEVTCWRAGAWTQMLAASGPGGSAAPSWGSSVVQGVDVMKDGPQGPAGLHVVNLPCQLEDNQTELRRAHAGLGSPSRPVGPGQCSPSAPCSWESRTPAAAG